jgi:ATP-dependent RNA helicase RhlE
LKYRLLGKPPIKSLNQFILYQKPKKTKLLIELIDKHRDELALVFSRTKHGAEKLMKTLDKSGFSVTSVHGNKSQGQRERALKSFRAGEIKILVATDVAARGLDIPQVRHVYNFDLPNVGDNYVHRIGRTARAGAEGAAIAFCAPDEMGELKAIEKAMGRSIPVASGRPWDDIQAPGGKKPNSRGRSGRKSARNGSQGGAKPGGKPQITGAQKARQRRKAKSAA